MSIVRRLDQWQAKVNSRTHPLSRVSNNEFRAILADLHYFEGLADEHLKTIGKQQRDAEDMSKQHARKVGDLQLYLNLESSRSSALQAQVNALEKALATVTEAATMAAINSHKVGAAKDA